MAEFFVELRFSKAELAHFLPGMQKLGHRIFEELMSRGLRLERMVSALGPDRGALAIAGLPIEEPAVEKRLWGPLVHSTAGPADAARELGYPIDALVRLPTTAGWRYAVVEAAAGRPTREFLEDLTRRILVELDPVLPELAGIFALFEGQPLALDFREASSEVLWRGPRGDNLRLASFEDYREALSQAGLPVWNLVSARLQLEAQAAKENQR